MCDEERRHLRAHAAPRPPKGAAGGGRRPELAPCPDYTRSTPWYSGAHGSGAPSGLRRPPAPAGPQAREGHLASLRRDGGHPLSGPATPSLPDRTHVRSLRGPAVPPRGSSSRDAPRCTAKRRGRMASSITPPSTRRRARTLRDLFDLVGGRPGTEVVVDGKRVPYGHELWLPLFWIFVGAEAPAASWKKMPLAEDLAEIEKQIRQLQIEWDKFFGGLEKKPPTDLKIAARGGHPPPRQRGDPEQHGALPLPEPGREVQHLERALEQEAPCPRGGEGLRRPRPQGGRPAAAASPRGRPREARRAARRGRGVPRAEPGAATSPRCALSTTTSSWRASARESRPP